MPKEEEDKPLRQLLPPKIAAQIRMLLSRVDHKDPKLLAEEANTLWTLHGQPTAVGAMHVHMDLPSYTEDSAAAVNQGVVAFLPYKTPMAMPFLDGGEKGVTAEW